MMKAKNECTHVHTGTWYFAYLVVLLRVLKKPQRSAPRAADATRYARARKDATETCIERGRKKRPMIIWYVSETAQNLV